MTGATVDEVARRIAVARRVTVLTGAGLSAASGVPTFRGPDGLWRNFQPSDLATPEAFDRNPFLVWEWYAWRRELVSRCRPNPGHEVLSRWTRRTGFRVLTQNVDDLLQRAGACDLVRLHGSLWEIMCVERCPQGRLPWREERVPLPQLPPLCPYCGACARPAVVWFGEALESPAFDLALAATACDVFLSVGTSAVVYPAAGLIRQAAARGALTIEINSDATDATTLMDVSLIGRAEEILVDIDGRLSPV